MLRLLLALYVLALGAPVLDAMVARAAVAGATTIDLCTGDGVRRIALDERGQPVKHAPLDDHRGHDCTACQIRCSQEGLRSGTPLTLLPPAWPLLGPLARGDEAALAPRPAAAHGPLPARGPPTLS